MVLKSKNKSWDNELFIQNTKHRCLPLYAGIAWEELQSEHERQTNGLLERARHGFLLVFSEREIRLCLIT